MIVWLIPMGMGEPFSWLQSEIRRGGRPLKLLQVVVHSKELEPAL